ncbi:MAG: hypothetical protein IPK62_04460 [Bacteroidetes bacterium]|nr:hypothetical protein [Bacteroidota bacterium]MBK8144293.1 hypothetical protein [Bacteroidota bacterium]MBP6314245.1 hypothetical protein [Chitinophagaceae bacterium]
MNAFQTGKGKLDLGTVSACYNVWWKRQPLKKQYLILIFALLSFTNCRKLLKCNENENLTFAKNAFNGTQLKLNGYYYYFNSVDSYWPIFFYKNGIVSRRLSYAFDTSKINQFEAELMDGTYYKSVKGDKYSWGLYQIDGNAIKYEVFASKSAASCYYPVILTGTIINDTTIHFTNKTNSDGTDSKTINEIYHFKQFSPKPDSTNSFTP